MGRRSINGHSRRRSNKRKASACEMVDAGSSPMKMTEENKDKLLMASSATTLDPVSMIATRMVVDKRQRERVEEQNKQDGINKTWIRTLILNGSLKWMRWSHCLELYHQH